MPLSIPEANEIVTRFIESFGFISLRLSYCNAEPVFRGPHCFGSSAEAVSLRIKPCASCVLLYTGDVGKTALDPLPWSHAAEGSWYRAVGSPGRGYDPAQVFTPHSAGVPANLATGEGRPKPARVRPKRLSRAKRLRIQTEGEDP